MIPTLVVLDTLILYFTVLHFTITQKDMSDVSGADCNPQTLTNLDPN